MSVRHERDNAERRGGRLTFSARPRSARGSGLRRFVGFIVVLQLILNSPALLPTIAAANTDTVAAEASSAQVETTSKEVVTEIPPTPTPSPTPTEIVLPTSTPKPTETPVPPTETPIPQPTIAPTDIPILEPTAEPTIAPPTNTPTAQPAGVGTSTPTLHPSNQQVSSASIGIQANEVLPLTLTLAPSESITVGATASGQAEWRSAPAGRPTGTVQYLVFTGSGCTGSQFADGGTQTINSAAGTFGTVAASSAVTFSSAGRYSWRAIYSGDSAYAANAVCSEFSVNKAAPTIAVTLTPTSPTTAGAAVVGNAPLTNATTDAGGTVTYTIYTDNTCTTQVTPNQSSTQTVINRVVPASDPINFDQVGTFYWKAVYSGDANNLTASSSCVTLVITKSTPTHTLTITPSPVFIGNTATVTSNLTNISRIAGGTVIYTLYTNSTCTTQVNPAQTSTKPVTNGVAQSSDAVTFATLGTFYWRGVYSGDTNSNGATSTCTAIVVSKASPTLTITAAPNTGVADSSFVASATLTNTTGTVGGTVTYTLYSNSTCSTTFTVSGNPSTKTVVNGVVPDSTAVTLVAAATRYWRAAYGGDASNNTATSACLAVVIEKASPTINLVVNPTLSPMKAGGTARGAATLTGSTAAAAGTVVYTVYSDSACTTVQTLSGNPSTVTVASGVPPLSAALTFNVIGTYYWKAVYNGDANNNGASSTCIPLVVAKSDPSMTLTITSTLSPMKAAGTATGKGVFTLTGATAGGSITYRVYTESTCTTSLVGTNNPSTKTVTNRVATTSAKITINQAGTVYWQAVYTGDANNNSATSPCTAQSVAKSDPTLVVTPTASSSPLKAGGNSYARGTLSAATSNASGTVLVTIYTDNTCLTTLSTAGNPATVTVTNKVIANSPAATIPYAGTIYWRTVYSGDTNNNSATSNCVAQTVAKATPTLALTISANVAPMTVGGSAYGKVTMTAATINAAGNLTYTVYSDATCATTLTAPGSPSTVIVSDRAVPNSASITINSVGTVYWRASYAGDANNATALSGCISLAVAKTLPTGTLTVTPLRSPMVAGGSATGSMTLSGATSNASGTVTYTVYTNNSCTIAYSVTGSPNTKTLTAGVVPSSDSITFDSIGTFYWIAVYSGDTSNTGVSSACVALSVVGTAISTISLSLSPNPAAVDAMVAGSASLSGTTITADGTVTYTIYTNSSCTTTLSISGNPSIVTVVNNAVPNSSNFSFSSVGIRYWQAIYSGDPNNSSSTSPCIALTVSKTNPSVSLTFSSSTMEAGTGLTSTAVFSGASTTAGGSLTYTVYSNNLCSIQVNPTQASTVNVVNGISPASASLKVNTIGTAYWRASYVGDTNNNASTSPCTPITVVKADSILTLTLSSNSIMVWDNAFATATLSRVTSTAGGTVVYTGYIDSDCGSPFAPTRQSTKTVTSSVVPASASYPFDDAGIFYWQAVYSGDSNNESTISTCAELTVNGGALTASVTSTSLNAITYSDNARTNTGSLTLTVTDQRGTVEGWTVSLSVSNFAYSGPSPNATSIDSSAFSITSANTPTVVSGQTIDPVSGPLVPAANSTGPLNAPVVVLTADIDAGAGVYTQTLNVSLAIPAKTQAGSYTAVLYTMTSAAP